MPLICLTFFGHFITIFKYKYIAIAKKEHYEGFTKAY